MRNTRTQLQYHENMTRRRGETVLLFKAHKCPCGQAAQSIEEQRDLGTIAEDAARVDYSCYLCRGNGVYWDDPLKVRSMITDVNSGNARQLLVNGEATPGDLIILPPPQGWRNLRLNDLDKIIFNHRGGQPWEGDVIFRAKYDPDFDFTTYPIADITQVSYIDPDDNGVPPTPVVCERGVDYEFTTLINGGTDVAEARKLRWLEDSPNKPPDGTRVSISYYAYYEWIAYVSPFNRVENNNLLGQKALLRKRHVAGLT